MNPAESSSRQKTISLILSIILIYIIKVSLVLHLNNYRLPEKLIFGGFLSEQDFHFEGVFLIIKQKIIIKHEHF